MLFGGIMVTYTVKLKLHLNINFSKDELKRVAEEYKRDCLQWNLNQYSKQNLEFYFNDKFTWDLNDYEVDWSENNIDDVYNEIEKYL